jgi:hypothetical protein
MSTKIIILIYLLLLIKCQKYYGEVNGHTNENHQNGYAGDSVYPFSDFYLCSDRKYRVHFFGNNDTDWSPEYTACQHVSEDCEKTIDGITISGGLEYRSRINKFDWLGLISGYDINDSLYGFAGVLGKDMYSIYIFGDEYYRAGVKRDDANCSNEKALAKNFIINVFGEEEIYNNFPNDLNISYTEIEIYKDQKTNTNFTVLLLNTSEINFKGKMTIKIEQKSIIYKNFGGHISNNLKKELKNLVNFDADKLNQFFNYFCINMTNGDLAINFYWLKKKIEIDVGIKILPQHYSYRGGYRFNIYLDDSNQEQLLKVELVCKAFLKYSGRKIPNSIEELLSNHNFNSFTKLEEIMNHLGVYSIMAEEVILFIILEPILNLEKK